MKAIGRRFPGPRAATALILVAAVATIGTALFSQHVLGYIPCKLCLYQRWPYYIGIPLALALLLAPLADTWRRFGLALLALVLFIGAAVAVYHSGVEWGWWLGPSDCGGSPPPAAAGMGDFLKQLESVRVVSCTEAPFRVLGLSMAGWNALVSLALAALAAVAAGRHYGSSSVSQ